MSLAGDAARMFEAGKQGVSSAPISAALRAEEPGWAIVLDAQRAVADPSLARMPSLPDVAALASSHGPVVWRAAVEVAKSAMLAFDGRTLAESCSLLGSLQGVAPEASLWFRAMRRWQSIAVGNPLVDENLEAEARTQGDAELVVESVVLAALSALRDGDLVRARELARRASRMARTEALPQAEYLANLVLARLRRRRGFPHLARRILGALEGFASRRWHPWIRWERSLCGGDPLLLASLSAAANAGNRNAYEAAARTLRRDVAGFAPLAADANAYILACDVDASPDESVAGWCAGESERVPLGVYAPDDAGSLGYVAARPGHRGRRILPHGQGLFGASLLPRQRRKQSRVETLVSVLALAGPKGLEEADAFRRVYGFALVPELHRGTFDVAQHRARAYLGDYGTLEREGTRVRLSLQAPVLVPDPRCVEPMENRLLRALAGGATTAKAAAEVAGVSLRRAQSALQALADEGACLAEKEGRRLAYRVEDTTFAEPTAHR
ncbi:MAG: hypothetical protein AAGE52_29080 [Myxococcota bacterium]